MKKFPVSLAIGAIVAVVVMAMGPWTTVSQGEVKVASLFGKVQPELYTEGFNFPVNPMLSFDAYDTKQKTFKLDDVSIPSQDKFKSQADVTVVWTFDGSYAPEIRNTVGTMSDLERKVLREPILSILREAGRDVPKAQDLFDSATQNKVQSYVQGELSSYSKKYGVTINAVFIKDITLPQVIQTAIVKTKQLEEKEAQEQANLNQQKLIYRRQVEEALAAVDTAEANKQSKIKAAEAASASRRLEADAKAYQQKKIADATLYAKKAEAKGNKAVAASVTNDLLKLKEVEVDLQRARSWQGGCTSNCTSMGSEAVTPLYHMNKGK